ncbi:MAG TPA: Gfo/Idh/MocA family oxidoreductase, partial [Thermomicrobiales bacterium]|nr:Gfo/Idh/MocA family oxidoreductase [Thermomicrobiales bacterium]
GALHARAVAESGFGALTAVADLDSARARDVAAPYGANVYADFDAMLDREALQAVIVATPEMRHRDAVVAAARHGCAVLVEKPIAASLDDADAMIAACDDAGAPLMVGYILRFEPAYARIQQAVASGAIGRFLSAYGRRNAPIGEGERLAGRTTVINYLAVHDLDQILWCNPADVTRVVARAIRGRIFERFGVADFTWIMAEFAGGALAVVESGWALSEGWASWSQPAAWGGFGDVEMNVIGDRGVVSLDFTPMNLYGVDADEGWKLPDTRHWPVINGRLAGAIRSEIDHFLLCAATGEPPLVDGRQARRSLEIGLAADLSIVEDRPVELPLR